VTRRFRLYTDAGGQSACRIVGDEHSETGDSVRVEHPPARLRSRMAMTVHAAPPSMRRPSTAQRSCSP
jgi:hypothetical protein